jgi:hypothetical protein
LVWFLFFFSFFQSWGAEEGQLWTYAQWVHCRLVWHSDPPTPRTLTALWEAFDSASVDSTGLSSPLKSHSPTF